jgi:hypothetical protein
MKPTIDKATPTRVKMASVRFTPSGGFMFMVEGISLSFEFAKGYMPWLKRLATSTSSALI